MGRPACISGRLWPKQCCCTASYTFSSTPHSLLQTKLGSSLATCTWPSAIRRRQIGALVQLLAPHWASHADFARDIANNLTDDMCGLLPSSAPPTAAPSDAAAPAPATPATAGGGAAAAPAPGAAAAVASAAAKAPPPVSLAVMPSEQQVTFQLLSGALAAFLSPAATTSAAPHMLRLLPRLTTVLARACGLPTAAHGHVEQGVASGGSATDAGGRVSSRLVHAACSCLARLLPALMQGAMRLPSVDDSTLDWSAVGVLQGQTAAEGVRTPADAAFWAAQLVLETVLLPLLRWPQLPPPLLQPVLSCCSVLFRAMSEADAPRAAQLLFGHAVQAGTDMAADSLADDARVPRRPSSEEANVVMPLLALQLLAVDVKSRGAAVDTSGLMGEADFAPLASAGARVTLWMLRDSEEPAALRAASSFLADALQLPVSVSRPLWQTLLLELREAALQAQATGTSPTLRPLLPQIGSDALGGGSRSDAASLTALGSKVKGTVLATVGPGSELRRHTLGATGAVGAQTGHSRGSVLPSASPGTAPVTASGTGGVTGASLDSALSPSGFETGSQSQSHQGLGSRADLGFSPVTTPMVMTGAAADEGSGAPVGGVFAEGAAALGVQSEALTGDGAKAARVGFSAGTHKQRAEADESGGAGDGRETSARGQAAGGTAAMDGVVDTLGAVGQQGRTQVVVSGDGRCIRRVAFNASTLLLALEATHTTDASAGSLPRPASNAITFGLLQQVAASALAVLHALVPARGPLASQPGAPAAALASFRLWSAAELRLLELSVQPGSEGDGMAQGQGRGANWGERLAAMALVVRELRVCEAEAEPALALAAAQLLTASLQVLERSSGGPSASAAAATQDGAAPAATVPAAAAGEEGAWLPVDTAQQLLQVLLSLQVHADASVRATATVAMCAFARRLPPAMPSHMQPTASAIPTATPAITSATQGTGPDSTTGGSTTACLGITHAVVTAALEGMCDVDPSVAAASSALLVSLSSPALALASQPASTHLGLPGAGSASSDGSGQALLGRAAEQGLGWTASGRPPAWHASVALHSQSLVFR